MAPARARVPRTQRAIRRSLSGKTVVVVSGRFIGSVEARVGGRLRSFWTGDPAFDGCVAIRGHEATARALLGSSLRHQLRRWSEAGLCSLRVEAHGLVAELREAWGAYHRQALSSVVHRLTGVEPVAALLQIATQDPEVRVRAGAAETLLKTCRGRPELSRVAMTLARSENVRVRHRLDALWLLSVDAPESLFELVDVRQPEVLTRVLVALSDLDEGSRVASQTAELLQHPDPRVAEAAARLVGRSLDPVFEPILISGLSSGPSVVRTAAAEALGSLGRSPRAARALRDLSHRPRETRSLRLAAKAALDAVSERLPSAGSMAVLEPEESEGTLSLTPEDEG